MIVIPNMFANKSRLHQHNNNHSNKSDILIKTSDMQRKTTVTVGVNDCFQVENVALTRL